MKHALVAAVLLGACPAQAQTMLYQIDRHGELTADWPAVAECAKTPFPKPPADATLRHYFEMRFQQIDGCRIILSARHAGWLDAGRKADENPWPPAPLMRDDDLKHDFDWGQWLKL